jgi:peptidoglycan/LPS O-acetylase OafA/YrhL
MSPPPYVFYDERGYLKGLDGLRAFSVLLVIVGHFGFDKMVPGGLGVTIFFFLSGFLITTLLRSEQAAVGQVQLGNFYIRRFLRLAPELYAFLLITMVAGRSYGVESPLPQIAAGFAFFTNYLNIADAPLNIAPHWPQLWSLAVEEHFYLTFPLLLVLCRKRPNLLIALLGLVCVLGPAWRLAAHLGGAPDLYTDQASECRMDSMAWGCLASLIFERFGRSLSQRPGLAVGGLFLGGALMLGSLVYRDPSFRETVRFSIQGLSLGLGFWGLFFCPFGRLLRGLLEFGPLRWMGRRSYAAYLWNTELHHVFARLNHGPASDLPLPQRALVAGLAIPAAFAVAEVSYRLFLSPLGGLRRRFELKA